MRGWLAFLLVLFGASFTSAAQADEIRPATIELIERADRQWSLEWVIPVSPINAKRLSQPVIPGACEFQVDPVQRAAPTALFGSARLKCSGDMAGQSFGFDRLIGNSDAIARLEPLGEASQTFRLTANSPQATIRPQPTRWQLGASYLVIGIEHILTGWDHLLFVIALVLLVRRHWAVVKAATAFTIAHSITLVASTLGFAGLPSRPVEALIALSILFLAVELVKTDWETWTRRWPWLVAFLFGLLHGFGFAGALAEIGLPEGEVALALLAFNLGVELGQLAIIAVVLLGLTALSRFTPRAEPKALKFAAYAIGITASYWLIERIVL